MTSTYRKRAGAEDDTGEGKKLGPPMPCTFCGSITAHETLCALGARCVACFRAYCAEPRTSPDVGDKKHRGARDWAWALKRREEAGAILTPPQKKAWRDALRHQLATPDDVREAA